MGKTSSIPSDKITETKMEALDKIAAEFSDSERTISNGLVGIAYYGSQAQDDDQEADSDMVLPSVRGKDHGYTDGLELDSASHPEGSESVLVAQRQDIIQIHPKWLEDIDQGKGMWTAFKQFRAHGKQHDKYYLHKEYSHKFRSKPNVIEFTKKGTFKGKPIKKRSAETSTENLHDYNQSMKRQRMKAPSSSSSLSTGGRTTSTFMKLPHGFV